MFTKHLYVPGNLPVTDSVREYAAISQSSSVLDLMLLSGTSMSSLDQMYVVTGPPVEVQVRVKSNGSAVTSDISSNSMAVTVAWPGGRKEVNVYKLGIDFVKVSPQMIQTAHT